MKKLLTVGVLSLLSGLTPNAAMAANDGGAGVIRMAVAGPAFLLLLLSSSIAYLLILIGLRNYQTLFDTIQAASNRLPTKRLVHTLWGFFIEIMLFSVGSILIKIKPLSLIAVAFYLAVMVLAGYGICIAAITLGKRIQSVLSLSDGVLKAFQYGLWLLIIGSIFPVVGWLVVITLIASGIGALVASLIDNRSKVEDAPSNELTVIK